MNLNKARDFYSAYFEGTLDAGLTQAFDRALETEAEVKAEYEQFVRIMMELYELKEPVEVPDDLHLMIRERVDAHILESEGKDKAGAGFFAWRPLAYGAVAAAAIIGLVMSLSSIGSNSRVDTAGGIPVIDSAPSIVVVDGTVRLQFAAKGENGVTVTDAIDGEQIFSSTLSNQQMDSPLSNSSQNAVVVLASFIERYEPLMIGVPGLARSTNDVGIGSLSEFVKAVAGNYSLPVVVDSEDAGFNVSWQFETSDVVSSISDELETLGMKAEVREDGLLWISSE